MQILYIHSPRYNKRIIHQTGVGNFVLPLYPLSSIWIHKSALCFAHSALFYFKGTRFFMRSAPHRRLSRHRRGRALNAPGNILCSRFPFVIKLYLNRGCTFYRISLSASGKNIIFIYRGYRNPGQQPFKLLYKPAFCVRRQTGKYMDCARSPGM